MSDGMTPEELAALYHSPEATVGPEARPQCLVCGCLQGDYADRLLRGLCDRCEYKQAEQVARQQREEQRLKRLAHFNPGKLEQERAQEQARLAQERAHQQALAERQARQQARQRREDEYHAQLAAWAEHEDALEHQRRMAEIAEDRARQQAALGDLQAQPYPDLNAPLRSRLNGFWIGLALGAVAGAVLTTVYQHYQAKRAAS